MNTILSRESSPRHNSISQVATIQTTTVSDLGEVLASGGENYNEEISRLSGDPLGNFRRLEKILKKKNIENILHETTLRILFSSVNLLTISGVGRAPEYKETLLTLINTIHERRNARSFMELKK